MATNDAPGDPTTGLSIVKAGHSLGVTRSKTGQLRLIAAYNGTELVQGEVRRGYRMTLVPPPYPVDDPTETYVILRGRLVGTQDHDRLELSAGDTVTVTGLKEPVIFEAATDVEFLYFTTRPFFHYISGTLRDLTALAERVERLDGYTAGHCLRIQGLAFAMGKKLELDPKRLHFLDYGAYLHDLGKLKIPAEVLTKPAPLDEEEWVIVRRHPVLGREMLADTFMQPAGRILEQHHERLDGSGYPYGLAGDEVAVESYIVAVADSYDAMTSDRPYRRALPHDVAERALRDLAGRHFPRDVVAALFAVLEARYV